MKTRLLKSAIIAVLISISTNMSAFTAVVSGAWSSATTWGGIAPGATVSNQDIIIPTGITVDLDIDVTFNGLINTFTVDGTLNSASNNSVWITGGTFAGSGSVDIHRLSFSGLLTTTTFTGTLNLNSLQNQGSTLTMSSSTTISDTLDLDSGSMILGTGSNLTMAANSNVRVNAGTLTTTGGVFSTSASYDVWYYGASKTTGLEINSSNLRNLWISLTDFNQVLTQGLSNFTVNGDFSLNIGQYNIGPNHLTLNGNYTQNVLSVITSTATTDLTFLGTGMPTSNMIFSVGSTINNIEVNRTNGDYKLGSDLSVAGTIYVTDGHFTLNAGTLTMAAGSTIQITDGNFLQFGGSFDGTASYDVNYVGTTNATDIELSGTGLNNVRVGMTSNSDTLTLTSDVTVNGNLDLNMGMLSLDGNDITLDGTFDQNAAAPFLGDSTSRMTLNLTSTLDTIYFGGNSMHLDELVVNIPATTSILLASNLTIHNSLDFTSGKIEITNSNLNFRPGASVNGFDDTRYIVTSGSGQVEMQVVSNATYITYPIGTMTEYAPAFLQQTSTGTTGMFKVRSMDNVYSQGTTGFDASSTEAVVDKTWVVDAPAVAVVNMNVRFGWKQTDEVNGFNRAQSHIAKYNNNSWDSYMTSAATTGPNTTYESTRNGVTSTGAFAVVDTSVVLGINNNQPIVAAINIYPNPTADVVTVETTAQANYLYEIFDVTGKSIASVSNANPVNKFDLSAYNSGFYFIRITNIESHATITKRIVKN